MLGTVPLLHVLLGVVPPIMGKTAPVITAAHYRVYEGNGTATTLDKLLLKLPAYDVVFLGEHHNDAVAHHLQALILKQAHAQAKAAGKANARPLALAMEMFERDVQHVLDEYLDGLITEAHFLASSRPWNNYARDYRPLVEFARENKLAVLASNAPRRYVNLVARKGADALKQIPDPARRGLPPLPYAEASPAYTAKFKALFTTMRTPAAKAAPKPGAQSTGKPARGAGSLGLGKRGADARLSGKAVARTTPQLPAAATKPFSEVKEPVRDHDHGKGLQSQSLWDATMAYTIAEYLMKCPQAQVIHVNGGFHSEKRLGIPEHLARYRPGANVLVVTILPHKAFPKFDAADLAGLGDFVIVTDPSLPRSYKPTAPARQ